MRLPLFVTIVAVLASVSSDTGGSATPPPAQGAIQPADSFPAVIPLGKILDKPARQPESTRNPVSYELGALFQLDKTHCLLVASMDEQGGPDLCVGNDGFVFEKISDIKAANAIALNRAEENYPLPSQPGRKGYLAKYPMSGVFVPLGARLEDGRPHPAAGTGMLVCVCVAFTQDRSDPTLAGKTRPDWQRWEKVLEIIQLRWDGKKLFITGAGKQPEFLGKQVTDMVFGTFIPQDKGALAPIRFADQQYRVVRFEYDGVSWKPARIGDPFIVDTYEHEPCMQRSGSRYCISTRGEDRKGRFYVSDDGFHFRFLFDWPNHTVPRSLNQGLDGSLYVATNQGPGWLRNPLLGYPVLENGLGQPAIIHDQDGVRDDKGDKIPFVDHALGANLLLEGRRRHLAVFRVCDLKERTLYGFQQSVVKQIHGETGPIPKRPTSGLYMVELKYRNVTENPWGLRTGRR